MMGHKKYKKTLRSVATVDNIYNIWQLHLYINFLTFILGYADFLDSAIYMQSCWVTLSRHVLELRLTTVSIASIRLCDLQGSKVQQVIHSSIFEIIAYPELTLNRLGDDRLLVMNSNYVVLFLFCDVGLLIVTAQLATFPSVCDN